MTSIIIPIYNAEMQLDKCLASILLQDTTEWECILVNDGSTDNSAGICNVWALKDSRFKFINQVNQGVSVARNIGLDHAIGEWVTFVDADDWLEPNYLSAMIKQTPGTDIVVSGQIREFEDGHAIIYKPDVNDKFIISPEEAEKFNNLNVKFLLYAPHEKIFRTDIIKQNNLSFQVDCSYGEDLQFVYSYLEYVNTIGTINQALYHYRIAKDGTLSSRFREDQFSEDYRQWRIVYLFYDKHGLLNNPSNQYLAKRLWGIVYDGIFLFPQLKNVQKPYLDWILCIKEIEELKSYTHVFSCAKWIKWAILNRCSFLFYVFFRYKQAFRA